MRNKTILLAAAASLAAACSGTPPSTSPPQPTATEPLPTPTSATPPTSPAPAVLPSLTLAANELMWSGDPPPISDYRITFCDGGVIEDGFVPLTGLAQPAYVSDDFGERTIRRAEADGDGFTLSVERECPIPPTPTQEIACTLEAVDEYIATIDALIATSNDDLQQYLAMLQPDHLFYEEVYREIFTRHMSLETQLRGLNFPPCLREVHDETLAAMGYRFSVYNAIAGLPRPDPALLQAWLNEVNDLADQSNDHLQRAGDLMSALLQERFGLTVTPAP